MQELPEVLGVDLRDDLQAAAAEALLLGLHSDHHVRLARARPGLVPACFNATDEGLVDLASPPSRLTEVRPIAVRSLWHIRPSGLIRPEAEQWLKRRRRRFGRALASLRKLDVPRLGLVANGAVASGDAAYGYGYGYGSKYGYDSQAEPRT